MVLLSPKKVPREARRSREAATPFLDNGEIGGFPEFFTFLGSALGGFIWRPEFFLLKL